MSLWGKVLDLVDDVKDFKDATQRQGLGTAIDLTASKLFGVNLNTGKYPVGEGWQFKDLAPGIQNFSKTGDLHFEGDFKTENERLLFGQIIDPNEFIFGGGRTKKHEHTSNDVDEFFDVIFAGSPGEWIPSESTPMYQNPYKSNAWTKFNTGGWEYSDIEGDWKADSATTQGTYEEIFSSPTEYNEGYSWKDYEHETTRWLNPGEDGGLNIGEEKTGEDLALLREIFDLRDFLDNVSEEYHTKENPLGSYPFDEASKMIGEEISKYPGIESIDMPFDQPALNLILSKDDEVKRILNIEKGAIGANKFDMLEGILELLDVYDADDVYHLDAGVNRKFNINKTKHDTDEFPFMYTTNITGTHIK